MFHWTYVAAFVPCLLLALPQQARSEEYLIRVSMIEYENTDFASNQNPDSASNPPKTRLLRSMETIVREGQSFYAKSSDTEGDETLTVRGKLDRISDTRIDGEVRVDDRHYIGIDRKNKDGTTEKMYDGTGTGFKGGSIPVLPGKPHRLHTGSTKSSNWYLELLITRFDPDHQDW